MPVVCIADIGERTCQRVGCPEKATHLAVGRDYGDIKGHTTAAFYCRKHAYEIANEGYPEYHHECPNCGCIQGVN